MYQAFTSVLSSSLASIFNKFSLNSQPVVCICYAWLVLRAAYHIQTYLSVPLIPLLNHLVQCMDSNHNCYPPENPALRVTDVLQQPAGQICNTGDINKQKNYAEGMIIIGNVTFDLIVNSLCAIQKSFWIVCYLNYFFSNIKWQYCIHKCNKFSDERTCSNYHIQINHNFFESDN